MAVRHQAPVELRDRWPVPRGWPTPRRTAAVVVWLLPWLLTVGLAVGLHLPRAPEPIDDVVTPFIMAHELVAEEVERAVGPLEHLPATDRAAFRYTSHFSPIPAPGPEDWLSVNPERGQTVQDYIDSHPNEPEPRDHIYILPVGPLPYERGPTTDELAEHARRFFGMPVVVLPVRPLHELNMPSRVHGGHRQLHAVAVLDALQAEVPRDAYCLIAVTLEDLYPSDDFNYVFGLARLKSRVGVFSFARYHPEFFGEAPEGGAVFTVDRRLMVRRALKVMSHEIGHMFGVEHCIHLHCVMNGANHLSEVDRAPMHLCPVCLRKLHVALGFDPEARYRGLAEHYGSLGLDEAADWAFQRAGYLRRERGG